MVFNKFKNGETKTIRIEYDRITLNKGLAATTGAYNVTVVFTAFPNDCKLLYSVIGDFHWKHGVYSKTDTQFVIRVGNDGTAKHTLKSIEYFLIGF